MPTSPAFEASATRFKNFFGELHHAFVERDDTLRQVAIGLLAREHVLLTGPPGTAKSALAASVLGRIVDEKTGRPSVYARQFTESTVQTDLVGPIDFKTLMQTGRTEHFTDEGMLGAVHSFLDEVLDGRDMLLRTTLNVLHERELKQGTKTTRGAIECALMTTNRYLAEVLESSRDTLLAFIDRVAFVSFVPRSFAKTESLAEVVKGQLGTTDRAKLEAPLTIQDLDVLQAEVDEVVVTEELCDVMIKLLDGFDREQAQAAKADPTYLPTRYLSTRTAVKLGRILRAASVYDRIVRGDHSGDLNARFEDLSYLRLSLILCGPPIEAVDALISREADARERRQLAIVRTERTLFDRVLGKLEKPKEPTAKSKKATAQALAKKAADAKKKPLAAAVADAKEIARTAATTTGGKALVVETVDELCARAVAEGLGAGLQPEVRPIAIAKELESIAKHLDEAGSAGRPAARWVRGRAIDLLRRELIASPLRTGELLDTEWPALGNIEDIETMAALVLAPIREIHDKIAELRSLGAEEPAIDSIQGVPDVGRRAEDELYEVLDTTLRDVVAKAAEGDGEVDLDRLLRELDVVLGLFDRVGEKLVAVGGNATSLKSRLIAPRVLPLIAASFAGAGGRDRLEVVRAMESLLQSLERRQLLPLFVPVDLLRLVAEALLRHELRKVAIPASPGDLDGYRTLRKTDERVPLAYTLVELGVKLLGKEMNATDDAFAGARVVSRLVAHLPEELRSALVRVETARIARQVAQLESWWTLLGPKAEGAVANGEPEHIGQVLASLATSHFFHVTRDERAFARVVLELALLEKLFPEAEREATGLRARVFDLEARSHDAIVALRSRRSHRAWAKLLGTGG